MTRRVAGAGRHSRLGACGFLCVKTQFQAVPSASILGGAFTCFPPACSAPRPGPSLPPCIAPVEPAYHELVMA